MAATNPISVGYSAVWSALNAWPPFTALVKPGPGTQVNAQSPGYVPPTNAGMGDRPSIRLGEGKITYTRQRNSKVVAMSVAYPLQVSSGQWNIDKISLLNTVVLQALDNAGVNLGLGIVYKWELASGSTVAKDLQNKRGEWSTAMTINVIYWIPNAEFRSTVYA